MLKRTRMNQFDDLPYEMYYEIILFMDYETLKNFVLVNKSVFETYRKHALIPLDDVRLYYMNEETPSSDTFHRTYRLFSKRYSIPEKIVVKSDEEMSKTILSNCGLVNRIILEELFSYNKNTKTPHFFVAGGYVLSSLTGKFSDSYGEKRDVDVFLLSYGKSDEDLHETLRRILMKCDTRIRSANREFVVVKNNSTINVHAKPLKKTNSFKEGETPLQFVLRRVNCVEELLCFFDLDACRFGFDGTSTYTTFEGIRALEIGLNIVDKQQFYKKLYFRRTIKYSFKGYDTVYRPLKQSIHPLMHLHMKKGKLKKDRILELIGGPMGARHENKDLNIRTDTRKYKWRSDIGMYSPFIMNVKYDELKTIADIGIKKYCESLPKVFEFDDVGYEENDYQFPLKNRETLRKTVEKERHIFTKSFEDLYHQDYSIFIQHKYYESHLWGKYDFAKCYVCQEFRYIEKDLSFVDEEEKDAKRKFDEETNKMPKGSNKRRWRFFRFDKGKILEEKCGRVLKEHSFCEDCMKKEEEMFLKVEKFMKFGEMKGRNCVVTGGRIKLGYAVSLCLLRAGGRCFVTTRFPKDAWDRYMKEKDFEVFKDRLEIYPLNLKKIEETLRFCQYLKKKLGEARVHVFVNCAAQTVRRPVSYYLGLVKKETEDIIDDEKSSSGTEKNTQVIPFCQATIQTHPYYIRLRDKFFSEEQIQSLRSVSSFKNRIRVESLQTSFDSLTEEDYLYIKDEMKQRKCFPPGQKDRFGEQMDHREDTSWTKNPEEVDPVEVFETQVINQISPSVLIQQLFEPLLQVCRNKMDKRPCYVINVTSIEGQFSVDWKEDTHHHTNMSKGGFNMFTRTSSGYFAKFGVIMNSVDTGWVSSYQDKSVWRDPPLDLKNGLCRILQPVVEKFRKYGRLIKNFEDVDW